MKQMKKRWRMLVPTVLLLAMTFSTTVFAAEEEIEYVPDLHATFWALCAGHCGDWACADYKRGLQFPVCWYFDGCAFCIRVFSLS